jgi:tRNA (guanine-N7-)-methyltransferase
MIKIQTPPADAVPAQSQKSAPNTPSNDAPTNRPHPPIRSYVLRQGRLSPAQARAIDEGQSLVIPYAASLLDVDGAFGRHAPTIVEIGFGMGHATADIAALRTDENFIGIEVHTPGVGSLLKMLAERSLKNVRVIQHDAVEVMTNMIADASLAGVHVYFPDPWPKKRHHKRRLIQPAFTKLLAQKLQPGGYIHCATDWQAYAEHMLEVLKQESLLVNTVTGFAPRPAYRTESNFERRGLKLGHGVWDVVFRKA